MGSWLGNLVGCLLALGAIGAVVASGRRLRSAQRARRARIGPVRSAQSPLDLYELAYLCGRGRRVAAAVVVRLHAQGRLVVGRPADRWITAEAVGEARDGIEAAVLAALTAQRNDHGWVPWPVELFDSDPPLRALRERLIVEGLLQDQGALVGVLHRDPVSRSYYRARYRFTQTLRWVPAVAVAGVVVAVVWRAYLPLVAYPLLVWAGRRHRDRYADDPDSFGVVTAAGHSAVRAAETEDRVPAVERLVHDVARSGLNALPTTHPLTAPTPLPRQPPQSEPEPPESVIDASPGLGGL
ncbi:TIGR04222 domain-containing membrane protein [Streptomyces sp. NPDC006733]|uniref:TIGR04222 domain-containing membrane protein n=1 Tax=Streptomyces sp. NPDC006733 TaxID=3155460 RepID=UPI0033ED66B0